MQCVLTASALCWQKNIFGGLGLGQGATVQLEFKEQDGAPVKTATVKAGGGDTETLPLFSNKQTIAGEVGVGMHNQLVVLTRSLLLHLSAVECQRQIRAAGACLR